MARCGRGGAGSHSAVVIGNCVNRGDFDDDEDLRNSVS